MLLIFMSIIACSSMAEKLKYKGANLNKHPLWNGTRFKGQFFNPEKSAIKGFVPPKAKAGVDIKYFFIKTNQQFHTFAMVMNDFPILYNDINHNNNFAEEKAIIGSVGKRKLPDGKEDKLYVFCNILFGKISTSCGGKLIIHNDSIKLVPTGLYHGTLKVDNEELKIEVVDSNYNNEINVVSGEKKYSGCVDRILIYFKGNGKDKKDFAEARILCKYQKFHGQYYTIEMDKEKGLTAKKANLTTGKVKLGKGSRAFMVSSLLAVNDIAGEDGMLTIPVGKYSIYRFYTAKTDKDGKKWLVSAYPRSRYTTVTADKPVEYFLHEPIKVRAYVGQRKKRVSISCSMLDQKGFRLGEIYCNGKLMPAPKITVVDMKGNILHQGCFEYG